MNLGDIADPYIKIRVEAVHQCRLANARVTWEKIDLIFNPIVESNSQFVGEIGERLRDIPMQVRNISGFDSAYGYKWVYTFEDDDGNVYSWFTTSQQAVSVGMKCIVTGTIKAHVEYKSVFTTQLSRCIIKEA